MNLLKEPLEPFVFGDPCLYLGEQVLGNVNAACLVRGALESDVLPGVQRTTVMAAASGTTAAVSVGVQGSGQDRRSCAEFFQSAVKHAADLSGVIGDAHGIAPQTERGG